jgi:hypothetical protein
VKEISLEELYSLRETIANLKQLEAELREEIAGGQKHKISKLLATIKVLLKTIEMALDLEIKFGTLVPSSRLIKITEDLAEIITDYVHDPLDRERIIVELEQLRRCATGNMSESKESQSQ